MRASPHWHPRRRRGLCARSASCPSCCCSRSGWRPLRPQRPAWTSWRRGLDSPRHLAFGSRGDLFVAEAGRGGDGPCFVGGEGPACMGATGAVTKIDRWGRQSRIAKGLASYANKPGDMNAIGPHGITVLGADRVFVTNGGPTEPKDASGAPISRDTLAAQNPVADLFGRLLRIKHRGRIRKVADLWAFERDVNPDAAVGNPAIDSNPVDVLFDRGRFVVADAGGNAIDVVNHEAASRTWRCSPTAWFPIRSAGRNPDAGRAHLGRRGPGSPVLRQPAHRLPVPARRRQRLPRESAYRSGDRLRKRIHEHHGPRVRAGTARCTCSRSTTTGFWRVRRWRALCGVPGRDEAADRPAAGRSPCPAASPSAGMGSTSPTTRARRAAGRCCASGRADPIYAPGGIRAGGFQGTSAAATTRMLRRS